MAKRFKKSKKKERKIVPRVKKRVCLLDDNSWRFRLNGRQVPSHWIRDFSTQGLKAATGTNFNIKMGDTVKVELFLRNDPVICTEGKVVWSEPEEGSINVNLLGIQFSDLDDRYEIIWECEEICSEVTYLDLLKSPPDYNDPVVNFKGFGIFAVILALLMSPFVTSFDNQSSEMVAKVTQGSTIVPSVKDMQMFESESSEIVAAVLRDRKTDVSYVDVKGQRSGSFGHESDRSPSSALETGPDPLNEVNFVKANRSKRRSKTVHGQFEEIEAVESATSEIRLPKKQGFVLTNGICIMYSDSTLKGEEIGRIPSEREIWVERSEEKVWKVFRESGEAYVAEACLKPLGDKKVVLSEDQ